MSDTKKPAIPRETSPARELGAAASRINGEATAEVHEATEQLHEMAGQTEKLTQQAMHEAGEVAGAVTDAVARSADVATEVNQRVADQSRDVLMMGARAAADVNGQIVDIGYGRGHRMLSSAAHVMDIYRDTSEHAAERMQALFACYLTLNRNIQQMQHALLERMDHAVEHSTHKPQDLLRCKSWEEFAEVQRDLYLGAVNYAFDSSTMLLQMAGRAAQEAMRPLQGRG